jgi:hypothetical protein
MTKNTASDNSCYLLCYLRLKIIKMQMKYNFFIVVFSTNIANVNKQIWIRVQEWQEPPVLLTIISFRLKL